MQQWLLIFTAAAIFIVNCVAAQEIYMMSSEWSRWSPWSFCSAGVRVRVRACSTVRGFKCVGHNKEFQSCDDVTTTTVPPDLDHVDPWTEDRHLAMRQLYPDYEQPVKAAPKKGNATRDFNFHNNELLQKLSESDSLQAVIYRNRASSSLPHLPPSTTAASKQIHPDIRQFFPAGETATKAESVAESEVEYVDGEATASTQLASKSSKTTPPTTTQRSVHAKSARTTTAKEALESLEHTVDEENAEEEGSEYEEPTEGREEITPIGRARNGQHNIVAAASKILPESERVRQVEREEERNRQLEETERAKQVQREQERRRQLEETRKVQEEVRKEEEKIRRREKEKTRLEEERTKEEEELRRKVEQAEAEEERREETAKLKELKRIEEELREEKEKAKKEEEERRAAENATAEEQKRLQKVRVEGLPRRDIDTTTTRPEERKEESKTAADPFEGRRVPHGGQEGQRKKKAGKDVAYTIRNLDAVIEKLEKEEARRTKNAEILTPLQVAYLKRSRRLREQLLLLQKRTQNSSTTTQAPMLVEEDTAKALDWLMKNINNRLGDDKKEAERQPPARRVAIARPPTKRSLPGAAAAAAEEGEGARVPTSPLPGYMRGAKEEGDQHEPVRIRAYSLPNERSFRLPSRSIRYFNTDTQNAKTTEEKAAEAVAETLEQAPVEWSEWSVWSECVCGWQLRKRVCLPPQSEPSRLCPAPQYQRRKCTGGPCRRVV